MAKTAYVPQLATLVATPPSGRQWWHEVKYDGYRIGCYADGARVSLTSRNGHDWTAAYPEVVTAVARLGLDDVLLDGEVAVVMPDGRTSFQALQNASTDPARRQGLTYFVFDLLRLNGRSLEGRTLAERKALLSKLLGRSAAGGRLRVTEHDEGDGRDLLAKACAQGLEGIVSKRIDRPYFRGRSHDWAKSKCIKRQELVVGGFTDPEGSRAGIGALLVGYYQKGHLVFAGKVGTGFSHRFATELRQRLDGLEQNASPFDPPPPRQIARSAHWAQPRLVCEVTFSEWTSDGFIRHPVFQGLRADKSPAQVHRERESSSGPSAPREERPAAAIGSVTLSKPGARVWEQPAITRLDLANYYAAAFERLQPHVEGRSITVTRCAAGVGGRCTSASVSTVLREAASGVRGTPGDGALSLDVLIRLVDKGAVELQTSHTAAGGADRPTRLVFELLAGEDAPWRRLVDAARAVRGALSALDLESFCLLVDVRRLQVVAPIVARATAAQCQEFARSLSQTVARTDSDAFTARLVRGRAAPAKVMVDARANAARGRSIAAYSCVAAAGAPVARPLAWEDLRPTQAPLLLDVVNAVTYLRRAKADPWIGYWQSRQSLTPQRLDALRSLGRSSR